MPTSDAIGPWLVIPDEIPDPYNLTMTAHVDGVEWSHGNSGDTSYPLEELIAYMSRSETLYPAWPRAIPTPRRGVLSSRVTHAATTKGPAEARAPWANRECRSVSA